MNREEITQAWADGHDIKITQDNAIVAKARVLIVPESFALGSYIVKCDQLAMILQNNPQYLAQVER